MPTSTLSLSVSNLEIVLDEFKTEFILSWHTALASSNVFNKDTK